VKQQEGTEGRNKMFRVSIMVMGNRGRAHQPKDHFITVNSSPLCRKGGKDEKEEIGRRKRNIERVASRR
jgi:hypothetical protein